MEHNRAIMGTWWRGDGNYGNDINMLVNDGNKHFMKDRISKLRDNIYNLSGRGERKICFNIHCSLTRNQKRKSARKLSAMDSVDFVVVEAAVVVTAHSDGIMLRIHLVHSLSSSSSSFCFAISLFVQLEPHRPTDRPCSFCGCSAMRMTTHDCRDHNFR